MLSRTFGLMAEHWRGWDGKLGWYAPDGNFRFDAQANRLGHVTILLELLGDGWEVKAAFREDAGRLEKLASDVRGFLGLG